MDLFCKACNAPHDFDEGPDEGICLICGGPLVEDPEERGIAATISEKMVTAVNDGLAAVAVARGKASRGEN